MADEGIDPAEEASEAAGADDEAPQAKGPGGKAETKGRAKWPLRIALALLGVVVGLVVAEQVFAARDDGAFPHLNAYVADEALGVRLEPGFEGKVRLGQGPVTSFRINGAGYRGADWPAPEEGEIIVVGDSQVFGLGVEGSETFSAKLAEAIGRPVRNAGVPTYGPPEYHAVAGELLKARGAKTVVYTINVGNDLVEAHRPNTERHAVWDGWAVRKETAPLSTTSFPGRSWLYRQSHLAFAARKLYYERRYPELDDVAFPSEGRWQDLVQRGQDSERRQQSQREAAVLEAALRPTEIDYLEQKLRESQREVENLIYDQFVGRSSQPSLLLRAARSNPGDIVTVGPGEAGAPLGATAKLIRQGAAYRKKMEAQLKEKAAEIADEARKKHIVTTLAERDALAEKLAALRAAPLSMAQATSPLAEPLKKMKALCDEHGAALVVLVLPLDVMVSESEWSKYSQEPLDLSATRVLIDDILQISRSMGVRALDATEALAKAEPGAFLEADLHLSPKGHAVVAEALAETMKGPAPTVRKPGLPKGRSRLPRLKDWTARKELLVSGSDSAGCNTWLYQEWMLFRCYQKASEAHRAAGRYDDWIHGAKLGPVPVGVKIIEGDEGETMTFAYDGVLTFVAPIFRGKKLVADFHWEGERRQLVVDWPADQPVANEIQLRKQDEVGEPPPKPPPAPELCACHKKVTGTDHCRDLVGGPDDDCRRTYGDDCEARLGCAAGDPLYPPECADGEVNALALDRCFPTCDGGCKGTCIDWQGVKACVTP